jgi:hypothetical protein
MAAPGLPPPYLITALLDRRATPFARFVTQSFWTQNEYAVVSKLIVFYDGYLSGPDMRAFGGEGVRPI